MVGWLVGWLVGNAFSFSAFSRQFLSPCPCSIARDYLCRVSDPVFSFYQKGFFLIELKLRKTLRNRVGVWSLENLFWWGEGQGGSEMENLSPLGTHAQRRWLHRLHRDPLIDVQKRHVFSVFKSGKTHFQLKENS